MDTKGRNTFGRAIDLSPGRKVDVEVGDTKQPEFFPQLKSLHWGNECNLSVRLLDDDPTKGSVELSDGKVIWSRGDRIARFYHKPLEESPDAAGAMEFEVELSARPDSNVLGFSIRTKGLDFYYQPPMTAEFSIGQKFGDQTVASVTETEVLGEDGKRIAYRPEHVVGSYVAYHSTKKNNEYRTGKAFCIPRPWAQDANGVRVWCDLEIATETESMQVIVPQDFLDGAIYPVIVDPTFGYTSIGGSTASFLKLSACKFTAPAEDGNISSITSYVTTVVSGTTDMGAAIYSDSAGTTNARLAVDSGNVNVPTTPAWYTNNITYSFTASAVLWLAHQGSGDFWTEYYDVGGANQHNFTTGHAFETWPDPFGASNYAARQVSIYATYTPVSASQIKTINGLALANVKTFNGLAIANAKTINGLTNV